MNPKPELKALSDLKLEIKGLGGSTIPYLGYIEAEGQVPVIVDTTIIGYFTSVVVTGSIPKAWKMLQLQIRNRSSSNRWKYGLLL